MSTKSRGRPSVPQFNEKFTAPAFEESNAGLPEHLHGDYGDGLDFRMPLPPWNDDQRQTMADNLARLRVDPTSTNPAAAAHSNFTAALLAYPDGYPDEWAKHRLAEDMAALLSENRAEAIESFLGSIIEMAKKRDKPPHAAYNALRAYYDFLESNGFEPTHARLARFIAKNPDKYPRSEVKDNSDLLWLAGLSRLAKSRGI